MLETEETAGNCYINRRLATTASVVRRVVRLRRIVSPGGQAIGFANSQPKMDTYEDDGTMFGHFNFLQVQFSRRSKKRLAGGRRLKPR